MPNTDTPVVRRSTVTPSTEVKKTIPENNAKKKRRSKEQHAIDRARKLVEILRANPGNIDDAQLIDQLESQAQALETLVQNYVANKEKIRTLKKEADAEAKAARAQITIEVKAKKQSIEKQYGANTSDRSENYASLKKLYNNVYFGAKRKILSDDSADNDALAKLF